MITVWGRRNSLNVQKVMWTLGELGLEYQRHDAGGSFGFDANYPSINPNATVPTIRDGELTQYESNACVRYLARNYGFNTLCPVDPVDAAQADQWMDWQSNTFSGPFFAVFFNKIRLPIAKSDAEKIETGVSGCANLLVQLDQQLIGQTFILGDTLTMADIPLGTLLFRYFEMEIERPDLPNVERYYAALTSRRAYQKHVMVPFGRNSDEWQIEEKNNAGVQ